MKIADHKDAKTIYRKIYNPPEWLNLEVGDAGEEIENIEAWLIQNPDLWNDSTDVLANKYKELTDQ